MSSSKCEIEDCKFETWEKGTKCVLHCNKNNELEENSLKLFTSFYNILAEYVANQVDFSKISIHTISGRDDFIQNIKSDVDEKIDISININKVIFPNAERKDSYYFFKILKKIHKIFFIDCEFFGKELAGGIKSDLDIFYDTCIFHNEWIICNENNIVNGAAYYKCLFKENVKYLPFLDNTDINANKFELNYTLFWDCELEKRVTFSNVKFNAPVFYHLGEENEFKGKIDTIYFDNCTITEKSKLVINNHKIGRFILKDTEVKAKFEFKKNEVEEFFIYNSNFEKDLVVDMYETKFSKFNISKSIFEGFVGFEKCVFSTKNYDINDQIAQFTYATFLSFVNFRNAKFYGGLDLENTNLKESPNFLNIEVNEKFSNRETFRIIKNAFDSVGNNLEGNKFFAYEMRKYREELKNTDKHAEKIIFFLNEKISNFGQNYVRPIILIIVTAIVFLLLTPEYEYNVLYLFDNECLNFDLMIASEFFNGLAKSILPLHKFLKEGMEFLSLIFYIIYVSLTWQTLVALKRHTKR